MHINELPGEILNHILLLATRANEVDSPTFTYGLSKLPGPFPHDEEIDTKAERYVRGPLTAEGLRWDATKAIRQVCSGWHEWANSYNFEQVFERSRQGRDRWLDLTFQREQYPLYELIVHPKGVTGFRPASRSLENTAKLFASAPSAAKYVRRLWFNGYLHAETDKLILSIISNCPELTTLSVPYTVLRRGTAADWKALLNKNTGRGSPLQSLEIKAVSLREMREEKIDDKELTDPLEYRSVDFSALRRLKIFGNTAQKPITDHDLELIARTATGLKCLDFTNISTISVAGMLALVKASRETLEVLEHSPRSNNGFYHPLPGHIDEHICDLIAGLPKMRDLSMSVPSMCADLFANHEVKWKGECQVRTLDICDCDARSGIHNQVKKLRETLDAARALMVARRRLGHQLNIEIFFAGCIFYPEERLVHGDFTLAEICADHSWPQFKQSSTKGPYGSSGVYDKKEGAWDAITEEDFLHAVSRHWISLQHDV